MFQKFDDVCDLDNLLLTFYTDNLNPQDLQSTYYCPTDNLYAKFQFC